MEISPELIIFVSFFQDIISIVDWQVASYLGDERELEKDVLIVSWNLSNEFPTRRIIVWTSWSDLYGHWSSSISIHRVWNDDRFSQVIHPQQPERERIRVLNLATTTYLKWSREVPNCLSKLSLYMRFKSFFIVFKVDRLFIATMNVEFNWIGSESVPFDQLKNY